MQYGINNDKETNRPITLKCLNCRDTWQPFGRGGVNACPNCGTGILDRNPKHRPWESSYRIVRIA